MKKPKSVIKLNKKQQQDFITIMKGLAELGREQRKLAARSIRLQELYMKRVMRFYNFIVKVGVPTIPLQRLNTDASEKVYA